MCLALLAIGPSPTSAPVRVGRRPSRPVLRQRAGKLSSRGRGHRHLAESRFRAVPRGFKLPSGPATGFRPPRRPPGRRGDVRAESGAPPIPLDAVWGRFEGRVHTTRVLQLEYARPTRMQDHCNRERHPASKPRTKRRTLGRRSRVSRVLAPYARRDAAHGAARSFASTTRRGRAGLSASKAPPSPFAAPRRGRRGAASVSSDPPR